MQKLKRIYILMLSVILILGCSFSSYADWHDLLIATNSNALMTLELDDSDYMLMSPRSSVGTVTNTVDEVGVIIRYTNGTYTNNMYITPELVNDRFKFNWSIPDYMDGYYITYVYFCVQEKSFGSLDGLPKLSGNYNFSMDFSSDFSYEKYSAFPYWLSTFDLKNSLYLEKSVQLNKTFSGGDFYISPIALNIRNGYNYNRIVLAITPASNLQNFGGSFAMRFEPTTTEGAQLADSDLSLDEVYENNVSDSLSDLSSSVDSMTEDLSSAAENLEYISTSQNLIIQGIDNVVMHISDQLFAFWNQLYNLIHVPTMAKMDDIISAIQNMDLEIEVNLDGLKSTINNMSTAIQNKLQSVQNAITNGFDNAGINQDAAELDQSLQEYEEAEQTVIDQVNDSLNDFEFDSGFEEYTNTIKVFSDFIQDLYEASGGFKVVINLSLMLSIAGIVIGVYRFRDGG